MELALQRYSWVGTALAAVLGAYLCARIVNTVVATAIAPKPGLLQQSVSPQAVASPPRTELDAERLAKSFDLPLPKPASETGPAEVPAKVWNATPARSSVRATLVGTALANPARYSLCQMTNGDTNETLVYAIGDKFMGTRIYAIEKDRVLIDNDGHNEYIDNSAAAAPNLGVFTPPNPGQPGPAQPDNSVRQLSENQYTLGKSTVNAALTDLSQLATQARIVPSFKNGVANGFKLFSIVPDSLYAKIGIQNGDVIRRINGYEMNSPDKALEIYQKLRDANRIEVEIERRGETIRKSYSIE